MAADRARRLATWAAAVARVPTATPGTVPWEKGATRWPPGPDERGGGIGEVARELVTAGREAVTARLAEIGQADPARIHARRVRRSRIKARLDATAAFGFAAVTGVAVAAATPVGAEVGLGAVTVAAGVQAVRSGT
ncbi:MAG TPA: hypothetical protein VLM05_11850, partial [Mycobacteriales bacterium]|nr:hypothetical protein [Mycobacteriales bacterium]